jgi:hypothetical protein
MMSCPLLPPLCTQLQRFATGLLSSHLFAHVLGRQLVQACTMLQKATAAAAAAAASLSTTAEAAPSTASSRPGAALGAPAALHKSFRDVHGAVRIIPCVGQLATALTPPASRVLGRSGLRRGLRLRRLRNPWLLELLGDPRGCSCSWCCACSSAAGSCGLKQHRCTPQSQQHAGSPCSSPASPPALAMHSGR